MVRRSCLFAALLASGCVPAPKPAPPVAAPSPQPSPTPTPPPLAADWRDWPQTPGDWRWMRDAGASTATFTGGGGAVLRCDLARRTVSLSVPGTAPGTAAATLTIRTTSVTRTIAAVPGGDPAAPRLVATLAANDPLLDAMGFSRGRFVVQQADAPPLVLPAWAEVERVVQDCRG